MIWSRIRTPLRVLILGLCICVFAAYLVPEWRALSDVHSYFYQNAWDEYVYMSWQGALGARHIPGYYPLYLVVELQKLGISGSIQNLAFDTLLPPLTAYFIYRSLRLCGIEALRACSYSVIICFASVLFNATNPLLTTFLSKHDPAATLMGGWEDYPSILRTPSPQTSYLFIAMALFGFLRYRKPWILLTPLPLLYYYTAIPFCFLVAGGAISVLTRPIPMQPVARIALCSLIAFISAGVVADVLSNHMGPYAAVLHTSAATYFESHKFQIPIVALACGGIFFFVNATGIARNRAPWTHWMLWVCAATFATGNLQLITGTMISQKNYYDYGVSILGGMAIALILEVIASEVANAVATIMVLAVVAYFTMTSQLPWYRLSIDVTRQAAPVIEPARKDPQHAVVTDWMISSIVTYGTAKMIAPPLSFQNVYPFVERQCDLNGMLEDSALAYAMTQLGIQSATFKSLSDMRELARQFSDITKAQPYKNLEYCQPTRYEPAGFRLLSVAP